MAVLVAVTDSEEGARALEAAVAEAELRGTSLLVANLRLSPLDVSGVPVEAKLIEREPGIDPGDHVLNLLDEHEVELLVIGMKRRTPVGKLVLGSLAQRLLLNAAVPVLAVKVPQP